MNINKFLICQKFEISNELSKYKSFQIENYKTKKIFQ